ncbi:relaxase/mobilization nuclease domain-containing protein [Lacticaseibacillus suibinensis]|uniref:relaxase/mobilization nuclease domain-containing protein n=1 Tax=Lacticaseibacillus suibinensis TaxID=2486011 RepID=UPI001941B768|nr:relaxase/mobilization nuclease domain-containing protein [Lacticaseibacillus suibinensis]
MATIKLSAAKSAGAAISYAEGKDKLGEETKDWLRAHGVDETVVARLNDRAVAVGGENVDVEHVRGQMRATRELFHKNTGVQAHRVIQSFAVADLNAADPADWERANALGVELGRLIAPGHEVAVYTHIDGEGHKLHNHIIINAPDLETGEKYHQHNDFARITKLNDRLAQEHGLSVIEEPIQHERRTITERHIDAGGYVWKDDLRSRIDAAMSDPRTSDFEALSAVLRKKGVDMRVRGKNVSYAFIAPNEKLYAARGTKLGESYEKGAIEHELARRTERLEQAVNRGRKVERGAERLQQSADRGIEATQGRIDGEQVNRGGLGRAQADAAKTIRQSIERFAERVRDAFERTERTLGNVASRVRQAGRSISSALTQLEQPSAAQMYRDNALDRLDKDKKYLAFWTSYAERERALMGAREKYETIQHNRKGWFRIKPVPTEHAAFVKRYEQLANQQAQALASTGLGDVDLRSAEARVKNLTKQVADEERTAPKPLTLEDRITEAKRGAERRRPNREPEHSQSRPNRSRTQGQEWSR